MPNTNANKKGRTRILGFADLEEQASFQADFRPGYELAIFNLVIKDLNKINWLDFGNVVVKSLNTDKLQVDFSDIISMRIASLSANELTLNQSGTEKVIISDQMGKQEITQNGFVNYHAAALINDLVVVEIGSIGDVSVWVEESPNVTIFGFGNLIYSGSLFVTQVISGIEKLVYRVK